MMGQWINPDFVARWEPLYDARKYPLNFLLLHGAIARNAPQTNALKDALIALLHWKDGKTLSFVPGKSSARPNTVTPVLSLHGDGLAEFTTLFRYLTEAGERDFIRCAQALLDSVCEMWGSVVIPAFVLHVARPDRLPIIDQHTARAFLQLTQADVVDNPRITWHFWKNYIVFFHDAAHVAGGGSGLQGRYRVDRALFAYGKSLKGASTEDGTVRPTKPALGSIGSA